MKKMEFPVFTVIILLVLIVSVVFSVVSVITINERDAQIQELQSRSTPVENYTNIPVITPGDAVAKFIGEANLSDDEQEALRNAITSDQVIIQYHLNDPTSANMDGYALNDYTNMKMEYSFWAAYEYLEESGWYPTDWSWIRSATPTLSPGSYETTIGDRQVTVEVKYDDEPYPVFRIVDSYDGIILSDDGWGDYNATIYTRSGVSFLFNLKNGSQGTLHVGYDESVTWNDHRLEAKT